MSGKRIPLSKKQRFDVFKRDLFVCQYCGQKPPAVLLEVDHVVPVVDGGSNEQHNLLTACFDCNRGKAAGSLVGSPIDVAARRELLAERKAQAVAYDALLAQHRADQEQFVDEIVGIYDAAFEGWTLPDRTRASIRQFLQSLPTQVVMDAMELACSRVNSDRAFKYFCGICWRTIKGD